MCLANCPLDQRVEFKLALSSDDYWSNDRRSPSPIGRNPSSSFSNSQPLKSRLKLDTAALLCRASNLTDFFFDACVFDLMTSNGDLTFRESAKLALDDIRRHWPPYTKHYESNRSDLTPYKSLGVTGVVANFGAASKISAPKSSSRRLFWQGQVLYVYFTMCVLFLFATIHAN